MTESDASAPVEKETFELRTLSEQEKADLKMMTTIRIDEFLLKRQVCHIAG